MGHVELLDCSQTKDAVRKSGLYVDDARDHAISLLLGKHLSSPNNNLTPRS